jgi:serine phosphatase RsbU (regulator of sigma subunit)
MGWAKLSIRTRLVLVATVPQLVYTNVMTWLGNQTLHQALTRMDARLVDFPPLRTALHEIYSEDRLLLYVTISLFVGLVSAAGATLMANQLRKKLDHLRKAAGRIAQGDLDAAVGVRGTGEIGLIGEALDEVREKLRSRIDLGVANAQLQQDLVLARAVESMFLPRTSGIEHDAFALAAFHRLAPRCSGDIWHHHIEQDGALWVMLGDVAGTGPGPAMIAGALVTAYRIRVDRGELSAAGDLLQGLHQTVLATAKDRHPVALSLLSLTNEGALVWWNAGKSHLLVRRTDGVVEVLSSSAPALGEAAQAAHRQATVLAPGEVALAFTSGVLGALDASVSHLQELLASTGKADVAQARDQLGKAIDAGAAASHQEDVTLIVLGRKRGAA